MRPLPDYAALRRGLEPLRSLGGRLAIDDAGAGLASLQHILRLAPDMIKLDASLTRGIDGDRARRALASALVSFAVEMGQTIIAEGVESAAEVDALRSLGVRTARATTSDDRATCRPGADRGPPLVRAAGQSHGPMDLSARMT